MKRVTLIILNMVAILLALVVLAACAPSLSEQAQLERAQVDKYNAMAAAVRAEGDAAEAKARAFAVTTQAMSQANYQQLTDKLIWLQEAESNIIDNTFWAVVLLFIVLTLLTAMLTIQVWQLTLLREVVKREKTNY